MFGNNPFDKSQNRDTVFDAVKAVHDQDIPLGNIEYAGTDPDVAREKYVPFDVLLKAKADLDEGVGKENKSLIKKALGGKKVPNVTTSVATNGDFIVYDGGKRIVGRLKKGSWESEAKNIKDLGEAKGVKVPAIGKWNGHYFMVVPRDTTGMAGPQDKFSMKIVNKQGKTVKDLGSHVSLQGGQKYARSNGIIAEDMDLDEAKGDPNNVNKAQKKLENALKKLNVKFWTGAKQYGVSVVDGKLEYSVTWEGVDDNEAKSASQELAKKLKLKIDASSSGPYLKKYDLVMTEDVNLDELELDEAKEKGSLVHGRGGKKFKVDMSIKNGSLSFRVVDMQQQSWDTVGAKGLAKMIGEEAYLKFILEAAKKKDDEDNDHHYDDDDKQKKNGGDEPDKDKGKEKADKKSAKKSADEPDSDLDKEKKKVGKGDKEKVNTNPKIGPDVVDERTLTPEESEKKEEITSKMKDKKGYLQKKYGDKWKQVMHGTATKIAKNEGFNLDFSELLDEKLMYEGVAKVGDRIHAYDYEPRPGAADVYVEATVREVDTKMNGQMGYLVRVERDMFGNKPVLGECRNGMDIFVPYQVLDFDWEGRVVVEHDDNLDEAYNKDSVDDAIKSQNRSGRGKIKGKEAKAIHGLLKGWRGSKAEKDRKEELEIDPFEALEEAVKADPFSPDHLAKLKKAYGKINRIDPASLSYKKLTKFLDSLDKEHLQQLVDAKIKFLHVLAKNRIKRLGEELEIDEAGKDFLAREDAGVNALDLNPEDFDTLAEYKASKKQMPKRKGDKLNGQEGEIDQGKDIKEPIDRKGKGDVGEGLAFTDADREKGIKDADSRPGMTPKERAKIKKTLQDRFKRIKAARAAE